VDGPKLELSSKPFVDAMKPALEALADLKAAISALDQATVKNLRAQIQSAKTQITSAAQGFETSLNALPAALDKAVASASSKSRAAGKKVGKEIGEGTVEGTIQTVRAARQRLQAEYEGLFNTKGVTVRPQALARFRQSGVQLFPSDVTRLLEYKRQAGEAKQQADLQANLRAQFDDRASRSATPVDVRTLLGLTPDRVKNSARASAEVFKEAFAQQAQVAAFRTSSAPRVDPRTLLGLTPNAMGKSAAASAEVFKDSFAQQAKTEADRVRSATPIDVRTLLGLTPDRVRNSARASAAVFMETFAAQAADNTGIDRSASFSALSPRGQLSRATRVNTALSNGMEESEAVRRYGQAAVSAAQNIETLREKTNSLTGAKRDLTERSREVHSALRGVAGAAGALFLTYGDLIPLAGAFFISSAVKRAVSDFKDLEFQLKFVQAAAEDYSVSVEEMSRRLVSMSSEAGKTPVEAAKGLRLLAQSGLTASQALQALPAVMRTATIGELDMADAATTLTGAMHAFGLNVSDIEKIGDVFAKAGALSNTSVAQISESMKQASSVAQEYGLSIEDVTTTLVALAKRNITGSAAGTAVRNMYKDLAAPKGAGAEVAKVLGVSMFGPKGQIKDIFDEYIPELRTALSKLSQQGQVLVLDRIANERGGKALSALLGMGDEDVKQVREQLAAAGGFVRDAVATLNDTLQRDYDKLVSTFSSSLIKAGSAGSDSIRTAVQNLTDLVASPEFVGALSNLVRLAGMLANGFVMLASAAASPVAQLAALSGALLASRGLLAPLASLLPVLSGGLIAVGTGATVAGTALSFMSKAFAGFAVISGVLTLFGMFHEVLTRKDPYEQEAAKLNGLVDRQRKYNAELRESINRKNELEGKGPTGLKSLQDDYERSKAAFSAADAAYNDALRQRNARIQSGQGPRYGGSQSLQALGFARDRARQQFDESSARARQYHKELYTSEELKREQKAQEPAPFQGLPLGDSPLQLSDPAADRAKREAARQADEIYRRALKPSAAIKGQFDDANFYTDRGVKVAETQLQHMYDMGLVQYEQYETAKDALFAGSREARKSSLEEEIRITEGEISRIKSAAAEANRKSPDAVSSEQLEGDVSRLQQQIDAARREVLQLGDAQVKSDLDSTLRRSKGLIDATKSANDFLLVAKLEADSQREASEFRQRSLFMSEVEVAREEASRSVREKFLEKERDLVAEIAKYRDAKPEVAAKAQEALNSLRGSGPEAMAKEAGERAVQELRSKKIADTAKELKSGLADAIIEGGETGAQALKETLANVFLRKPLKILLEAAFDPVAQAASSALLSFFGLRAGGGPVSAGHRYLVGENGPEVLEVGQSGHVYNNTESRQMMAGRPQQSQTVQVTVAPQISIDSRSDQGQVQQLVASGVREGNRQMFEQLRAIGVVR
jgi:TP901 family phage tail tape measure protein